MLARSMAFTDRTHPQPGSSSPCSTHCRPPCGALRLKHMSTLQPLLLPPGTHPLCALAALVSISISCSCSCPFSWAASRMVTTVKRISTQPAPRTLPKHCKPQFHKEVFQPTDTSMPAPMGPPAAALQHVLSSAWHHQPRGSTSLSPAITTLSGTFPPLCFLPKPGRPGTLGSQRREEAGTVGRSRGLVRNTW